MGQETKATRDQVKEFQSSQKVLWGGGNSAGFYHRFENYDVG